MCWQWRREVDGKLELLLITHVETAMQQRAATDVRLPRAERVGHAGGFAERSPDRVAVEIGVPVAANSEEDHQRAVFRWPIAD